MLICMVGCAGSGKSTKAKELAKRYNCNVVSTDAIREEIFGSAAVQKDGDKIFRIAYDRLIEELQKNQRVIFDATNLLPWYRKKVLKIIEPWNRGFNICYKSITPIEIAKERNRNRERVVPEEVIDRQYEKYIEPTLSEGWDEIYLF